MNTPQTFRIKRMHCASCAHTIEKTLKKQEGIISAEVNYGTETAAISFDTQKINVKNIAKIIEPLGYSFILPTAEEIDLPAGQVGISAAMD